MRRAFALCGLLVISLEAQTNGLRNASNTSSSETSRSNNYYLRPTTSPTQGNRRHYKYLSACIGPFGSYLAKDSGFYRVPSGQILVVFDEGRGGSFNKLTGGNYPGFDPKLEFTFQFDLSGLQDDCRYCKIQINKGQSCDAPLTQFWDRSVPGAYNPWQRKYGAYYTSNHSGQAKGSFSMFDGYNFDDHKRRAVVVFAKDGTTKIGCGLLRKGDLGLCIGASGGGPGTSQPQAYPAATPSPVSPPIYGPTITIAPITQQPISPTSTFPTVAGTTASSSSPSFSPIAKPTRPPRPPVMPPSSVPPTWVNPPTKPPRPTKGKSVPPKTPTPKPPQPTKGKSAPPKTLTPTVTPQPTNGKGVPPKTPKGGGITLQPRIESPSPPKSKKKSTKKDAGPKSGKSPKLGPGPSGKSPKLGLGP